MTLAAYAGAAPPATDRHGVRPEAGRARHRRGREAMNANGTRLAAITKEL